MPTPLPCGLVLLKTPMCTLAHTPPFLLSLHIAFLLFCPCACTYMLVTCVPNPCLLDSCPDVLYLCQIRAEIAEMELILLEKEKELLGKEQTVVVLTDEVGLK